MPAVSRELPISTKQLDRYLTGRLGYARAERAGVAHFTRPGRTPVAFVVSHHRTVNANTLRLIARENDLGSLSRAIEAVRREG